MNYAQGWSAYNNSSPDYFNTCSTVAGLSPPYSFAGYQVPLQGNAYAGFVTYAYAAGVDSNYREFIGSILTSSLNIGTKYYFSFFVSFGGVFDNTMATDKIGLRFSTVPYSKLNPAPINNFADYYESTIITDSVNWVQIKGSYVADSAYKYITIGNFFDDAHLTPSDTLGTGQYNQVSYYYIDNVVLSTDSVLAYTNDIKQFNNYQSISLYPNPAKDRITITSNYFTSYKLISPLGDIKKQGKFTFNSTIEVDDLEGGAYILQLDEKDFYKIFISR